MCANGPEEKITKDEKLIESEITSGSKYRISTEQTQAIDPVKAEELIADIEAAINVISEKHKSFVTEYKENHVEQAQVQQSIRDVDSTITQQTQTLSIDSLPIDMGTELEQISLDPFTKQDALRAILGIVGDIKKISVTKVAEVKSEINTKLSQVQGSARARIKAKVCEFAMLSMRSSMTKALFKQIVHEALHELATTAGISDSERVLLGTIHIEVTGEEFYDGKKSVKPKSGREDPNEKLIIPEVKREATKEEIEKAHKQKLAGLTAFLKERDEVKRAAAEERLKKLIAEERDTEAAYVIDKDNEVVKVYTLKVKVVDAQKDTPLHGVSVLGGILGAMTGDETGEAIFKNLPTGTFYMIGVDHPEYDFAPEFIADTVTRSVEVVFRGRKSLS